MTAPQSHTPNLRDLADEDWRIQASAADAEAQIVRPDPDCRGFWVGPLATLPMGSAEIVEDGDGEEYEVLLLDTQHGRNLFAVAALPQFARLVCWTIDEVERLHLGTVPAAESSPIARFHRELHRRCEWLKQLIDERGRTLDDTDPNWVFGMMTYDRSGGAE